jgi:hypothetical protein
MHHGFRQYRRSDGVAWVDYSPGGKIIGSIINT